MQPPSWRQLPLFQGSSPTQWSAEIFQLHSPHLSLSFSLTMFHCCEQKKRNLFLLTLGTTHSTVVPSSVPSYPVCCVDPSPNSRLGIIPGLKELLHAKSHHPPRAAAFRESHVQVQRPSPLPGTFLKGSPSSWALCGVSWQLTSNCITAQLH